MTDADASADVDPPAGTKRRGSIEAILPSDDDNEPTPTDTPVDTPVDDFPKPIPTPDDDMKSNGKRSSKRARLGHRRRNTDSNIGYVSKSSFGAKSSNAAVIKLMQSELPPSQRLDMQRKASDLKIERELKHAQIKLQETQEQCDTAVEIIGNLQKENEDYLSSSDRLRAEYEASQTEIAILTQKVTSLEEVYRSDTRKLEEEVDSTKRQLNDLHEDMTQKNMALNEANEYRQTMQQRLNEEAQDASSNGNAKHKMTQAEKQLMQEYATEKKKVLDKDRKIERLLGQLEGATRLKHDNETLQTEIESLRVLAQQDLEMQSYQIEKMTQEIILLGSSNSQLVQEKEDLMALLEERDYENQMLKTGYGLHRTKTHANMDGVIAQLGDDPDFDDNMEQVEFANKDPMTLEEMEQYSDYNDYNSMSGSPTHKKPEKKVADVTREYLHLTASVVNMKFPRIQYSSEELIAKVKNYQFWEYHDMMVRIMKTEETKMLEKQKAEQETKATAPRGGMLGKFRNFFGTKTQPKEVKNPKETNRRSMIAPKTQLKGIKTRTRNQSEHNQRQTRGGSTIDKKAPSAPITMDDAKKGLIKLKESAKKKITGNPSEQDTQDLANMSFASVPFVGITEEVGGDADSQGASAKKKIQKPKKP
eukprot:543392_1